MSTRSTIRLMDGLVEGVDCHLFYDYGDRPDMPVHLEISGKDLNFESSVSNGVSTIDLSIPLVLASELGLDNENVGWFKRLSARAKLCGIDEKVLLTTLGIFVSEIEQSFKDGYTNGHDAATATNRYLKNL